VFCDTTTRSPPPTDLEPVSGERPEEHHVTNDSVDREVTVLRDLDRGEEADALGSQRVGTGRSGEPLRQRSDDEVRRPEEAGDERRVGLLVDLRRHTDLVDATMAEHREPVAHRERFLLVVCDVDERDADFSLDPLEFELHLVTKLEVEGAERLVEQQHAWPVDEGTGERHTLTLPPES
jgi:hypothetical protein